MIQLLAGILALLPTYLVRFQILGIPTTFLEILTVIFVLVAASRANQESIKKIKNLGWLNTAIFIFVLSSIVSTIISPDKTRALGQLKALVLEPILFFYAIIISVKSKEQFYTALRWLFVSASLISLFGLLQSVSSINLPLRFWGAGTEIRRITSIFEYPNALALYLGPLIGFFATLALSKYQLFKNRWVIWAGLVLMIGALLLTFSRGAWLAVTLGLLLMSISHFGAKKTILPAMFIILIALALPTVRQRVLLGVSDASSSAHLDLIKIGVNKIIGNPVLGNGLSGFRTTQTQAQYSGEILNYPHNIFLNFWLETGLLGLISFLAIFGLAWQKIKNPALPAGRHPGALALASGVFLLIVLLHGLVDVPYFKNDLSVLFWFVMALIYI
ncbi:MAG: hypothetical protein A2660_00560 [Candidatus Doudnabacteria bacterium RIFCSPHIGHO2_01_FULL_45_18]|uniref:O-antigen ligase-related domain-containing protein n=1 Tax=Candidatus Doudnabacteria bacterium RIFCSPHIGHO2_01_FULL_45_18 TaxID=1817823 RepID=A0A1F5NQZ1_9BACT|nr:MAG: hypothetical protein A2660_00560 [Candidatus Doudnabacteria bacterium RIFCSPHIGHO2_01_FULL_45_18]